MAHNIEKCIAEALRKIAPEVEPEDLDPTEDLREAVDLDSFDFLQVLNAVGQELGIEIPESDYPQLLTLNDMKSYLEGRL